MTKQELQIANIQAIFIGSSMDKDDFRGCPSCGSRNIWFGNGSFDEQTLSCYQCNYYVSGGTERDIRIKWNLINRWAFQLEIPFPET